MKTIKTAVVVVLLLAVLYGVYTVLNKPENSSEPDSAWPQPGPLQIDIPSASGEFTSMPGRDLADRADSDPPDMPASIPANLGGEFNPDEHSPAAKPGVKKPPPRGSSSYVQKGGPRAADSSYVRTAAASMEPKTGGGRAFVDAFRTANRQMNEGRHREALAGLSIFFDSPDLSPDQQRQLLDVLDPLAGKVIYSTEHLLESPYEVRKSEDLYGIARAYNVSWLLLKNINGVDDPEILLPGTRLKVMRGPFRADLKVSRPGQGELTLFLGDLYAGRFPVTIGNDHTLLPGKYKVQKKEEWPLYTSPNGQSWPSRHPQNPYGRWWLSLGSDLCIHSSPTAGDSRGLGCISLSPIDAADVYGILGVDSLVEIRE